MTVPVVKSVLMDFNTKKPAAAKAMATRNGTGP